MWAHRAINLSSTSSSALAWRRDGGMGEWLRSLGECFLFSGSELAEANRNRRSHRTRTHSVLPASFWPTISQNYGYQVAIFTLREWIWLRKILLETGLKSDRNCKWMTGEVKTNLYTMSTGAQRWCGMMISIKAQCVNVSFLLRTHHWWQGEETRSPE